MRSSEAVRSKSRQTRGQKIVLKALRQIQEPISAQALFRWCQQHDQSIGIATIYRSLLALKQAGLVQSRVLSNGESVYNAVQEPLLGNVAHCAVRHYLTCLACERSIQLDHCPFRELEKQWRQAASFQILYHTLEFFGICAACEQTQN